MEELTSANTRNKSNQSPSSTLCSKHGAEKNKQTKKPTSPKQKQSLDQFKTPFLPHRTHFSYSGKATTEINGSFAGVRTKNKNSQTGSSKMDFTLFQNSYEKNTTINRNVNKEIK